MPKKKKKIRQFAESEGMFTAAASGFGFVERKGKESIFIPADKVHNAITGDRVKVRITNAEGKRNLGPAGEILQVLSRSRHYVVGELLPGRMLNPLDEHFNGKIKITGSVRGLKVGDWIKVRLLDPGSKYTEALRGEVTEKLGETGSVTADLRAVAAEFDLPEPYTEAENEEAAKTVPRPIRRENLQELFTVTIDPEDAKDFDDAISISEGTERGTVRLGVHIADVAAWVRAGKKWDRKAAERGFSAYLPGMFRPMLPGALTALISLREGVTSPAHSVMFTVRESTGKILSVQRVHSEVKVDLRLNYDEVQEFLENPRRRPAGWTAEQREKIRRLIQLTRKMRRNRENAEHPLPIETTEIRVLCDSAAMTVKGLKKSESRESEQLVEECMLAANTAVAQELIERHAGGIFRVHAEPQEGKLADFSRIMLTDFRVATGDLSDRSVCESFLEKLPCDARKGVIVSNFLRSLPRAVYESEPGLHYGLGKYRYSHFTSPIRRYPDLLVHRQLWALDTNSRLMTKDHLQEEAERCSRLEERNDNAYFAANDRLKLHYLHQQADPEAELPHIYEAVIARIIPAGMLCNIEEIGMYGFIPAEKLRRSDARFNRNTRHFRAGRGHLEYKCGDIIYVTVDSLDFVRGRALFRPV